MKNFFEENFRHLKNFGKYIQYIISHLFCIILLIIILFLSCLFLSSCTIINPSTVESQEVLIAGISLDNWGIWFTAIGLIITAIWSMYQYHKNILRKQQEKASEIAKQFSNDLLLKCDIVNTVYKLSPIGTLLELQQKNYSLFKNFNIEEIRKIYNDYNFPLKYKKLEDSINFDDIYYSLLEKRITIKGISNKQVKKIKKKNNRQALKHYSTDEAINLFRLDNSNFPFHFWALVDNVLNDLEQVCMNISSKAAGGIYIYQSLHQVFLRTVRTLVVEISLRNNSSNSDKYYTNVIEVYKEWTKIYIKNSSIEDKKNNKVKKYKNKIEKILNPKIRTV